MLFEGEKIDWMKKTPEDMRISDDEINKKYLAGEVRIVTEQARYPLDTIRGMEGYTYEFHDFLDDYLIISNKFDTELLQKLKAKFEETILFAYELFAEKAFYLWRPRKTKHGETWKWFERSIPINSSHI